ncbi:glycosyltransferase, partial [candidate division KSB3 bacterium]|nr:glycosyltransferase [candidate division KSB3 bacterium]MBD3323575.1 glycosyltransferase [candidate division KSB3 bacterium]
MLPDTILYLNHVGYIGGAEVALLDLLRHLDRERYAPVVLSPAGALSDAVRESDAEWVRIPLLPGLNRYTLPCFLVRFLQLVGPIRRLRPALLHANTNFTSLYAGLIARSLGIPSIGHIHDIEPLGRMGRRLVRQNDVLIAISDAVQAYLVAEQVPADRIVRIHNGVDLQKYRPRSVRSDSGHEGADLSVIVGIVGQIGRRKGHLYLLEAVRSLLPRYPQLRVWIVGQEPRQSIEGCTEQLQRFV